MHEHVLLGKHARYESTASLSLWSGYFPPTIGSVSNCPQNCHQNKYHAIGDNTHYRRNYSEIVPNRWKVECIDPSVCYMIQSHYNS